MIDGSDRDPCLPRQLVRDHGPQDLAGSLVDSVNLGIPVEPLDREVFGVAVAAVHLDPLVLGVGGTDVAVSLL